MIDDPDQDLFAAEYVLGTLDADERVQADNLRTRDIGFDSLVRGWEMRLAPLTEIGDPVEPPTRAMQAILADIDRKRELAAGSSNIIRLRRQVTYWRAAAVSAMAVAAALAVWLGVPHQGSDRNYIAALHGGDQSPAFLVSLDLARHRMVVMPSATQPLSDKSYELWMIGGDASVPVSLGLLDGSTAAHPVLPATDTSVISRATYAVTLEPKGGSPTGQPTTTPMFTGHLIDMGE